MIIVFIPEALLVPLACRNSVTPPTTFMTLLGAFSIFIVFYIKFHKDILKWGFVCRTDQAVRGGDIPCVKDSASSKPG